MVENMQVARSGSPTSPRHRVVVVGGGFAGAAAAKSLSTANVDVLILDRRNHYIFQPLLYQVATAVLSPSEVSAPLRQLCQTQPNLSVRLAEVRSVDLSAKTVRVDSEGLGESDIPFDYLIVATGVRPTYFGHDEFGKFAPGLKTLTDAEHIRSKMLKAFEYAELTNDPAERASALRFILVGAGPTGVELAASIAQMAKTTLRSNFRSFDSGAAQVMILEGAPRILGSFHESLSRRALERLQKLGVTVRTGVSVESVDAKGVVVAGEHIDSKTVIWTAGVQASTLLASIPAERDRAGRILVSPQLHLAGHSNVFVIGDASVLKVGDRPLPGVAQVAIQQGRFVGKRISDIVRAREPAACFVYRDRGNMAVVGKNFAVLERGNLRTSGFFTFLVWACLHVMFLPLMQNRLRVQIQWLWSYFSGQRGSRVIAERATEV